GVIAPLCRARASLNRYVDVARRLECQREQPAYTERDPVRDRRLHDPGERVRRGASGRTGQLSPQDESDGKDAADESTVDRGKEEEVDATQRADGHQQFRVAGLEAARGVERVRDREGEDEGCDVVEEPVGEQF